MIMPVIRGLRGNVNYSEGKSIARGQLLSELIK